jgi:Ser/Thr protein kinase RdoA (MazF antagonist)
MSRRDPFHEVYAALAANPSARCHVPGADVHVLRRIDGPFSQALQIRVRADAHTTTAYLKILKPRKPGEKELKRIDRILEREYRATKDLYETFQGNNVMRAVKPLAYLPEQRALVTEEVPGLPMAELLADPHSSDEFLAAIATNVGSWIRKYQALRPATEPVDIARRRRYLDKRLHRLLGRVITSEQHAAMLERFDRLAADIGCASVPAVQIHADLNPLNIVVDDDGRIAVLDFTMAKLGTKYHDVTHMYFHLELLAYRHPKRADVFKHCQRALLAGFDPSASIDDPLFRMILLEHAVCHVVLLAQRRLPLVDAAYRWRLRRRWRLCTQMPVQPALQLA